MTCIVGIVDKGKVLIGADSASVGESDIYIRKDVKVFRNGDFVIGCTTSFRMMQLLRFSFKPPEVNEKDIYEYMCTDFVDGVRECFKNGGYLQKYADGDEKGGHFLVGYKDRLFHIEGDFQVGETLNGVESTGCGEFYALGALFSLSEQNLSAEDKIVKALEAAEFYSTSVRKPFVIVST